MGRYIKMLEELIERRNVDLDPNLKSTLIGVLAEIGDLESELELLRAWPRAYKQYRDPEGTKKTAVITPMEMVMEFRVLQQMLRSQSKEACKIRSELSEVKEERDTLSCMLGFETDISER